MAFEKILYLCTGLLTKLLLDLEVVAQLQDLCLKSWSNIGRETLKSDLVSCHVPEHRNNTLEKQPGFCLNNYSPTQK